MHPFTATTDNRRGAINPAAHFLNRPRRPLQATAFAGVFTT